jgi:hypothetical protein
MAGLRHGPCPPPSDVTSSNRETLVRKVGEAGHYLNRPGELRGGVLELLRANRDRLEQCVPFMDAHLTTR